MTKKVIGGVVGLGLLLGLSTFVYLLTNNKISFGYNDGYAPDQPVAFSHQLHAGELQIDCQYCHSTVSESRHASIPPLNVCMNCHQVIRQVDGEMSTEIAKVVEAYENNESIEWKKVHLLPDHVRFNHAAHIQAGKDCTTCHGNVEAMEILYQYETMSMGWCIQCHRQPENNAPINCSTCHY